MPDSGYLSQTAQYTGLLFVLIGGNFLGPLLSCGTQRVLEKPFVRHVFAFLMLTIFVVSVNIIESSQDSIITPYILLASMAAYVFFLILAKCETMLLIPAALCIIAIILVHTEAANKTNKGVLPDVEFWLAIVALTLVLVGFGIYLRRQYLEHRSNFSLTKFFFRQKCTSDSFRTLR